MRLIDADALIEKMKKVETDYEDAMTCPGWWTAYSVISEQPTAYDVEKVVSKLEEIKEGISGCFGTMCSECKYTNECYEGEKGYKVAIDEATATVRKGGVE